MSTIVAISVLYLVITLGIGVWAMRHTKTSADFFIAGKKLGLFVMAMASFSAAISGWVFVGGPGLAYNIGMVALWFTFPTSISFAMAWYILGKRMRLLADAAGAMTVADAIYARYESKAASGLAGLATLVGIVLYMATQVLALGTIISFIFNISITAGVIIGMGVVVFYSIAGGILAGVYTDAFQGTIMAVASIVVFVMSLVVGGGMTNISRTIATTVFTGKDAALPQFIGPWGILTAMVGMSWFFCLSIGIVGQPHIVTKFYMIKDMRKMKWGPLMAAIPGMITGLLFMGVGLVIRYLVLKGEIPPLSNPDDAISIFLLNYTHPVIAGIVFAGITSAVMSTCDSFINIAAAAAVRDLPFAFGKKFSDKQELYYGRIAVLIISIFTVLAALGLGAQGIALLGAFGWGTFAAALAPALGIGLNWKRATKEGAVASIAIGLGLNVALEILKTLKIYTLPHGIYNGTFSLVVSIIVFILISYATSAPELNEKMEAIMNA